MKFSNYSLVDFPMRLQNEIPRTMPEKYAKQSTKELLKEFQNYFVNQNAKGIPKGIADEIYKVIIEGYPYVAHSQLISRSNIIQFWIAEST